jgi:hypothetical protein
MLAVLLRVTVLTPAFGVPLSIAKLVTAGDAGAPMVTARELDQLEMMVVWLVHRALALTL